jgi:hypothetical protein
MRRLHLGNEVVIHGFEVAWNVAWNVAWSALRPHTSCPHTSATHAESVEPAQHEAHSDRQADRSDESSSSPCVHDAWPFLGVGKSPELLGISCPAPILKVHDAQGAKAASASAIIKIAPSFFGRRSAVRINVSKAEQVLVDRWPGES